VADLSAELDRRFGVLDAMLTAHSLLAARLRRRARALDFVVLGISILLVATAWLDPVLLKRVSVDADDARIILGVLSCMAFFLALFQLLVDWKESAGEHDRARVELAGLKSACRAHQQSMASSPPIDDILLWMKRADDTLVGLPAIPDVQFASLKASHRRKVEVSRLLDAYPGSPLFVLKAAVRARDTWRLLSNNRSQPNGGA
jgi:hypothetical protein